MLDALSPAVLEQSAAGEPEAMLQLRAAKSSTEARLALARVEATESQLTLSKLIGLVTQGSPAVPTTIPRSSPIDLTADTVQAMQLGDWTAKRVATLLPARAASLQTRAATIVAGDQLRVAVVNDYLHGIRPIGDVLDRMARQSRVTTEFLQSLAQYNQAVAKHALSSLPADAPTEELLTRLGVR